MSIAIPQLEDYATSRAAFLASAEARGAVIGHHVHPLTGPGGEEIATDVARLGPGPGEADSVVVVASGTHGVEGHAGSGLQRLILDDPRIASLPTGTALVLVHAVNPFGMAWSRRVDHDNVDVNRNFVDFASPPPTSPHYPSIDATLNPSGGELDLDDGTWLEELLAFAGEVGMAEAFQAVSGGQYDHPHGMQFGGSEPTWSRRTLESLWAHHLRDAGLVVHLDVHTGLGPTGQLTLFQTADPGEPAAELGARWYPDILRADRNAGEAELQHGVLGPGLDAIVGEATTCLPVVVEFGTLDELTVLGAMRADNWLHQHGDPRSEVGEAIRSRTRDAFFVEDAAWRGSIAQDGLAATHAAFDAVEADGADLAGRSTT